MQAGTAALENSTEVPQDVKNRATLQPSNRTTRYLSKGYKHSDWKGHRHPNVYSSNVHNSQTVEVDALRQIEWIKKMWYIYTMEYYSAITKDEYLSFALTLIELESIVLSEISQSEEVITWFHSYAEYKE